MRIYNPKKPLVFIHVPKTGGTSLKNVFSLWFENNIHFHYFDEKNNTVPPEMDLRGKPSCLFGHFNKRRKASVFEHYPYMDQFITILRNPLEMHLSNYFYLKKRAQDGGYFRKGKEVELEFRDVDEYIQKTSSNLLWHFPWELNVNNYQEIIEKHFIHIGVLENLNHSISTIAQKLNKDEIRIPFENKSGRDETPSPKAVNTFIQKHPLEYAIFDYAHELNSL